MKQTRAAKLVGLGTADTKGSFVTRPVPAVTLTLGGIEGDRHFGLTAPAGVRETRHPRGVEIRNFRQLSLVSVEELGAVASALRLPELPWQKLGANLVLEGLDGLTQVPPSSRLVFPSGATVTVDSENAPCSKSAREVGQPGFVKAAHRRRGLVGWVERAGVIQVGDAVAFWEPKP